MLQKFPLFLTLSAAMLLGCPGKSTDSGEDTGGTDPSSIDKDGDGYTSDVDCDDSDQDTYPGATEICDGVDNNCDGETDETEFEMYLDADRDSYGDPESAITDCALVEGYVANSDDCDDSNVDINPDGTEVCDGQDNDCDVSTLEDGMVELLASDGTLSDATALFQGTSSSVAYLTLDQAGETYSFCSGTYYVNIEITAPNVTLQSELGIAEDTVLDGGGQGTVVQAKGASLDTSLFDLTIQNGQSEFHSDHEVSLAGGVGCFGYDAPFDYSYTTSSSMTLAGMIIRENNADFGGGMLTLQCVITIDDTLISANTASTLGGLYVGVGSAILSNVDVRDHVDIGQAAGITLENWGSSQIYGASFQDVRIEDNSATATASGAALTVDGYDLSWTSTGAAQSSMLGNEAAGDTYAAMRFDGDFTAQGVDFGEDAAADDNLDVDLHDYSTYSQYVAGNNASFSCTSGAGCGTPDKYELGAWTVSGTSSSGFFGDVVYVDTRATVSSFIMGLANPGCPSTRAIIFERSTVANGASQSWTAVWSGNATYSNSFYESGNVGVVLETGKYYAFVLGYDCNGSSSGVHTTNSGGTGVDVGIGVSTGSVAKWGTYADIYSGSTLTMTYSGGMDQYEVDLFVTEL